MSTIPDTMSTLPNAEAELSKLRATLTLLREFGVATFRNGEVEIEMGDAPYVATPREFTTDDAIALVAAAHAGPAATTMSKAGEAARKRAYEALGLVPVGEMSSAEIALASAGTYDPAQDEPAEPKAPEIPTHVAPVE
jgi:hypothetical protein